MHQPSQYLQFFGREGVLAVAEAIRGVLFHEEAAEPAKWNRCWYELQEIEGRTSYSVLTAEVS